MPKLARELKPLEVERLKTLGLNAVGVVPGLHLQISESGARSWVLRIMVGSRRRDIGLGGYPAVTLAMAREKARAAREKIAEGIDPVDHAKAARSALAASQAAQKTFKECAELCIKAKEKGWKNAKHAAQWRSTLETYVYPYMGKNGDMLVSDVELPNVLNALEPIWETKTETATRVRSRIEIVLDWATTRKYRSGPNPARWRSHLDNQLPPPRKVTKVEHHTALSVAELPAFMVDLRKQEGLGARALEFAILTAARSGEVRGATWSEIDLKQAVWTIPAERMKADRAHRVALSPAAVKLLKAQPRMAGTDLVFPATHGGLLSDMTLSAVCRRMEVAAVPHGFRSTFRDWAAEETNYPREVAEQALAHVISDKTEAAYRRGDLFEKRRGLMEAWGRYCEKPAAKANVIPMKKRAAR